MKLLIEGSEIYDEAIKLSKQLNGNYNEPVIYHCYWTGDLNEKHLISIKTCYHFNVDTRENKSIVLWLENNNPNEYNDEIKKYAEIKSFDLEYELKDFFSENLNIKNRSPSFYSDVVRYMLLYNYGGCWFDLDIFFLRNFEPLFVNYETEIVVYRWENEICPNGAIYISLKAKNNKMKEIIHFIIERNRGWGFQEASLTFDLPLDLLVLPCSWFDPGWINHSYKSKNCKSIYMFDEFFENTDRSFTSLNFFKGAFCYHWHNHWNYPIEENSIIKQLFNNLNANKIIGITYASRHFENRKEVITKQANDSGFFDEFICFTEDDISEDFKERHKEVWSANGPKQGGGYWIWKPYIMQKALDSLNEDDIFVYIDSGCELNVTEDSTRRFKEYIDMVKNQRNGMLRFELSGLAEKNFTNRKTAEYLRKRYNVSDGFMNIHLNSPQIMASAMIVRKTHFSNDIVKNVLMILEEDAKLFTDDYTHFDETHRHDQSIFSMLEKIMYGGLVLPDETYFDDGYFSSENAKKFPIWVSRKK